MGAAHGAGLRRRRSSREGTNRAAVARPRVFGARVSSTSSSASLNQQFTSEGRGTPERSPLGNPTVGPRTPKANCSRRCRASSVGPGWACRPPLPPESLGPNTSESDGSSTCHPRHRLALLPVLRPLLIRLGCLCPQLHPRPVGSALGRRRGCPPIACPEPPTAARCPGRECPALWPGLEGPSWGGLCRLPLAAGSPRSTPSSVDV